MAGPSFAQTLVDEIAASFTATPSAGPLTAPIWDKGGAAWNVKATGYGALGNGRIVTDGAITASASTLTSASGKFLSTDVGLTISVAGAGASGANLVTTIASYTSATSVGLTATAGTTVTAARTIWGSDDRVAIQAAINAANTAGGGIVLLPPGLFLGSQAVHPANASYFTMLYLYPNVSLVGAGRDATTLMLMPDQAYNPANVYWIVSNRDISSLTDKQINVSDITIDGNAANQANYTASTSSMSGLVMYRAQGCKLTRVRVQNVIGHSAGGTGEGFFYENGFSSNVTHTDCECASTDGGPTATGFSNDDSTGILYENCIAFGMQYGQGFTANSCTHVGYVNCLSYRNGNYGFNCENGQYITYTDCTAGLQFFSTGVFGGTPVGAGNSNSGFAITTTSGASTNVTLTNCTAVNSAANGGLFIASGVTNVTVVGGIYRSNTGGPINTSAGTITLQGGTYIDAANGISVTGVVTDGTAAPQFEISSGATVLYGIDNKANTLSMTGYPAPTGVTFAANTTGGLVDVGAHFYGVSFVNVNGESAAGLFGPVTTVSGTQTVNLQAIPVGPYGTTARNLYRTKAGLTTYLFLHTIADNTTTTYADAAADSTLGTALAPTLNTTAGVLGIGATPLAQTTVASAPNIQRTALYVPLPAPPTANYGLTSRGAGTFDSAGAAAGRFIGAAAGTIDAVNLPSGATSNFADWQLNGVSKFSVTSGGTTAIAGKLGVGMTPVNAVDVTGTGLVECSVASTTTGSSNEGGLFLIRGDVPSGYAQVYLKTVGTIDWQFGTYAGSSDLRFFGNSATRMTLGSTGTVTIPGPLNVNALETINIPSGTTTAALDAQYNATSLFTVQPIQSAAAGTTEIVGLRKKADTITISGTLATQRFTLIDAPVVAGSAGSLTCTTAATFAVAGAPTSGTNAPTLTNPYSIWSQGGQVHCDAGAAGIVPLVLQSAASPTVDTFQVKNSAGTPIHMVASVTRTAVNTETIGLHHAAETYTIQTTAPATQRFAVLEQPTITSATTGLTVTTAATFAIANAPNTGAGGGFTPTITNPLALWVQAGASSLDGPIHCQQAAVPTLTLTSMGTSPSSSVTAGSNSVRGQVSVTVGGTGTPAAAANNVLVTFNTGMKFLTTPRVMVTPANTNAGANLIKYYVNAEATTGFQIGFQTAGVASTTYIFDYLCVG